MWKICEIINDWYDDGKENRRIREVLFEEVCNARVLVRGELVHWDHSQPSGNPLTVIVNSLFNQIVMRYAYMTCKREALLPMTCDFRKNVSLQTYGDDNVLNIAPLALEWYNQNTISSALASIGMIYTDENKNEVVENSRGLGKVSFLKRQFVKNEAGFFEGPLELAVCKEMPNWIREVPMTGKSATFENTLAAMREIFFHGKKEFNACHAIVTQHLRSEGIYERVPEYVEFKSIFNADYFDTTKIPPAITFIT
jgi:hypothetical protein